MTIHHNGLQEQQQVGPSGTRNGLGSNLLFVWLPRARGVHVARGISCSFMPPSRC